MVCAETCTGCVHSKGVRSSANVALHVMLRPWQGTQPQANSCVQTFSLLGVLAAADSGRLRLHCRAIGVCDTIDPVGCRLRIRFPISVLAGRLLLRVAQLLELAHEEACTAKD